MSFYAGEGKLARLVRPRGKMMCLLDLKDFWELIRVIGDPLSKMVVQGKGRGMLLMFYVDISVIAAYYCPEPFSNKAGNF